MQKITLIWFRRNLRLADNAVLQTAVAHGLPVVGVFALEKPSEVINPRRALFYYQAAAELARQLAEKQIPLLAVQGETVQAIVACARRWQAATVLADEAYTPSEIEQDNHIWRLLDANQIGFLRINDRTVFAKADLMSEHGQPYVEFEAYKTAWLQAFRHRQRHQPSEKTVIPVQTAWCEWQSFPEVSATGYPQLALPQIGGETAAEKQWQQFLNHLDFYPLLKDFPAKKATSQLGAYLSAGCLSPRRLAQEAVNRRAGSWLENLIRRDFYQQLMFHHPHIISQPLWRGHSNRVYQKNDEFFHKWTHGITGFPLIDASMRCLNRSGWLPPVLRRVLADFWCNTLQQDWQQGAAWFAQMQMDDDTAVNIGNWQTVAGLDTLTARRIVSPVFQSQQIDPDGTFIRRYLPELAHLPQEVIHAPWLARSAVDRHGYPLPMIDGLSASLK